MANDIERSQWTSTPEQPSARLCNFPTGKSSPLRPAHKDWLLRTVVPCGNASDNDGYYRAVVVKVHQAWKSLPDPPPPLHRLSRPRISDVGTKMYFDLGLKSGGGIVFGTQTLEAYLYSVDNHDDRGWLESRIRSLGIDLGGGVNLVFLLAFGGHKKSDFVGVKFDGWDVAFTLGERWHEVIKAARGISAVARVGKLIQESGRGAEVLRQATKLSPHEWEKIGELIKTSRHALHTDANAEKPELNVFDVPLFGTGLEVGVYRWWGRVTTFE